MISPERGFGFRAFTPSSRVSTVNERQGHMSWIYHLHVAGVTITKQTRCLCVSHRCHHVCIVVFATIRSNPARIL